MLFVGEIIGTGEIDTGNIEAMNKGGNEKEMEKLTWETHNKLLWELRAGKTDGNWHGNIGQIGMGNGVKEIGEIEMVDIEPIGMVKLKRKSQGWNILPSNKKSVVGR